MFFYSLCSDASIKEEFVSYGVFEFVDAKSITEEMGL